MPPGEFGPQFPAQQRGVRAGNKHCPSTIKKRPHQTLPFFNFLNFIQKHRLVRTRQLVQHRQKSGEILGAHTEEAGILKIAVKSTSCAPHQLCLQGALTATPHAGQDGRLGAAHREIGNQLAFDFLLRTGRHYRGAKNR